VADVPEKAFDHELFLPVKQWQGRYLSPRVIYRPGKPVALTLSFFWLQTPFKGSYKGDMSNYVLPVENARQGWKHGQKSLTWPFGHPGVDLLPTKPRSNQDVLSAKDGEFKRIVGGTCQGFDWVDSEGLTHRYCHVDVLNTGDFKKGEVVARMAPRGLLVPPGTTHLHWVVWKNGKQIDPLSLVKKEEEGLNVRDLFQESWGRKPARGEELYFITRVGNGSIENTREDLISKMTYWYSVVYPQGHYSFLGDARWQYEKSKVLLGG
jgi:hypothetical protein